MGRALILESTFLIDLERAHHRGAPGPAVAFLEANHDARLYLPFVVAGEMASGISMRDRARWEAFLAPFYVLPSTPEVSWQFGRASRHLRDNGNLIGANDLWIAATRLSGSLTTSWTQERVGTAVYSRSVARLAGDSALEHAASPPAR